MVRKAVEMERNQEPQNMNSSDVIVVIPTTNRPDMLRTALASIRRQTAYSCIKTVLVSENSREIDGTAAVCREFGSELPLRLVHREPSLSPNDHARQLLTGNYSEPILAILHDDDWWAPEHLARSIEAMTATSSVACYSGFFNVQNESAIITCDNNALFWLGSGFDRMDRVWALDFTQMALSSLPATPGRYSTLVAQTTVLRESSYVLGLGNPFDTDRMLSVALAERGRVAVYPAPSVYIRYHRGQGSGSFPTNEMEKWMLSTTRWILVQCERLGIDLLSAFNQRLAACPAEHQRPVFEAFSTPWLRAVFGSNEAVFPALRRFWQAGTGTANDLAVYVQWTVVWRAKYEAALALCHAKQNAEALKLLLVAVTSVESCGVPQVILEALVAICPTLARMDRGRAAFLAEMAIRFAGSLGRAAEREQLAALLAQLRSDPIRERPSPRGVAAAR